MVYSYVVRINVQGCYRLKVLIIIRKHKKMLVVRMDLECSKAISGEFSYLDVSEFS